MKCPHCLKSGKCVVLETRTQPDEILRRRLCAKCGQTFVSKEVASSVFAIPRKRERSANEKAARRLTDRRTILNDGSHLAGIWHKPD